jgi:hypothetical protein
LLTMRTFGERCAATDPTAAEPSDPGTFTFTRNGPTNTSLDVSVALTGSAANGVDYVALGITASFAAGSSNTTVTVNVIDDTLSEGDETVVLSLLPASAIPWDLRRTPSCSLLITTWPWSPWWLQMLERRNRPIQAHSPSRESGRPNDPLAVNFTVSGSASNGVRLRDSRLERGLRRRIE